VRSVVVFVDTSHGFLSTRHVSLQRCPDTASPFLHGVLGMVSPASSIVWDAPTPNRPLSAALRCLRLANTTVCVVGLLPSGPTNAPPSAPGELSVPGSRAGFAVGDGWVSQVPGEP